MALSVTAAEVAVDVKADTRHLDRGLDRSTSLLGGFARGAGKVAGLATAAGGAAAVAFGVKAVMAASDLNETLAKTEVVFGGASKQVKNFAQGMADDFGLPKTAILDAASGIGLIGKASGLSEKAAAGMATGMASLAADASSFYNVPLEEALGAIKSGLVGEAEPMRRFGVLLNEAAVGAEAVRLGLAKQGEELTEGMKAQARASLITRGMTDASGDLERTQGSLANRLRELRGRAENFAADFGTKLIPIVLKGLDAFEALGRWAGPLVADMFETLGDVIGPIVEQLGNLIRVFQSGDDVAQGFAEVMDNMLGDLSPGVDALRNFYMSAEDLWKSIDRVVESMGGWGRVLGIVGAAILVLVSPVAAVVAGIGLLVAAYAKFEGFRNVVNKVVGFVVKELGKIVRWFTEELPNIIEAFTHIWNVIVSLWDRFGGTIVAVIKNWLNMVMGVVRGVLQVIRGIITTVLAVINGDWGRAWEGIKTILSGAFGAIWSILKGGFNQALIIITGFIPALLGIGGDLIGAILSGIVDAFVGVVSWFAGLGGSVIGAIGDVTGTLVTKGKNVIAGFLRGVKDRAVDLFLWYISLPGVIVAKVGDVAGTLVEKGRNVISGFLRGVIARAEDLWNWYWNLGPKIRGAIGDLAGTLVEKGRNVIGGLISGVTNRAKNLWSWLNGLDERILEFLDNAGDWLVSVGRDAIEGLIRGVKEQLTSGGNALGNWIGDKLQSITRMGLKSRSPSMVMAAIGRDVGAGLALGIHQSEPLVSRAASALAASAARTMSAAAQGVTFPVGMTVTDPTRGAVGGAAYASGVVVPPPPPTEREVVPAIGELTINGSNMTPEEAMEAAWWTAKTSGER